MAFAELKARHSVVWGSGPYERITNTIRDIHALVIERADPKPGERVLDAATGTGAVAILAAQRGADVVGQDIAPVLVETARERAAEEGSLALEPVEAVVLVGVHRAAEDHHRAVARGRLRLAPERDDPALEVVPRGLGDLVEDAARNTGPVRDRQHAHRATLAPSRKWRPARRRGSGPPSERSVCPAVG